MTAAIRARRHGLHLRGRHLVRSRKSLRARGLRPLDVLIFPALALAVVIGLPVQWGGHASFIVVRGDSMLPTYATGDLVIVRESDTYRIGEVVAYRVPEYDLGAGTVILHRIIDETDDGGFVLQGDNNDDLDTWQPGKDDTVGKAVMTIPRLGRVLELARSPELLASLGFGFTFALFIARPEPRRGTHLASKKLSLWEWRRLRTR